MTDFLLRLEGVNLANYIEDTQDLSTVRGGGLQLLNASAKAGEILGTRGRALIEGASIGLFEVTATEDAEGVRKEVAEGLATALPHATFVVDVVEGDGDFR